MVTRVLPILNALGCIALLAVVLLQWRNERALASEAVALRLQIAEAHKQANQLTARRDALEHDVSVLKETIESLQTSAESTSRQLGEKSELAERLASEISVARQQVTAWESAIKERDARIGDLQAQLAETRNRLDEAILRLKEAGAR